MMMTMEDPFFRKTNTRPGFRSPKVVSIPISFVGSSEKKKTRSDAAAAAAARIQKVFRGFLVRKSVRKIVAIKRQVEEIERKVMERETAEMVRRDAKERLRINEMLMALLLRLDSVRGVDSGVRDCRKVVIRKAIALQEKLDATAEEDQPEAKVVDDDDEAANDDDDRGSGDQDLVDPLTKCESADHSDDCGNVEDAFDQSRSEDQEGAMEAPVESSTDEITEKANLDSETEMKLGEEDSAEAEITMTAAAAEEEEEDEKEMEERWRVMMERMLKDNEKLMGLMSKLCERNAMQTQMISSLSQRVENLEKAFICDKLKRKKKKRNAAATATAGGGSAEKQEGTPDARKCGRKL